MIQHDDLSTLDFLRAIATVDVVVCHLLGEFQHGSQIVTNMGRLAILIFFVHTSYVLMLSMERQQRHSSDRLWGRFMLRRCFRIYPLPFAVLALIVILKVPSRMLSDGSFAVVHLGPRDLVSNFALAMNLTHAPTLLEPLWSLPYEMQMYVFLPALFLLARCKNSMKWLLTISAVSMGAAALLPLFPHAEGLEFLRFVPCFLPGVIAYRLARNPVRQLPFAAWVVLVVMIVLACALLPATSQWGFAWIACLTIGVAVPFMAETHNRALRTISHKLAEYSYGVYLTHYFCIWLAFRANGLSRPWQWAIFAAGMFAVPVFAYACIERPMNRFGYKLAMFKQRLPRVPVPAESQSWAR